MMLQYYIDGPWNKPPPSKDLCWLTALDNQPPSSTQNSPSSLRKVSSNVFHSKLLHVAKILPINLTPKTYRNRIK